MGFIKWITDLLTSKSMNKTDLEIAVAYHEAGHAVAGRLFNHAIGDVKADTNQLGEAYTLKYYGQKDTAIINAALNRDYTFLTNQSASDVENAVRKFCVGLLAGPVAEQLSINPRGVITIYSSQNDYQLAKEIQDSLTYFAPHIYSSIAVDSIDLATTLLKNEITWNNVHALASSILNKTAPFINSKEVAQVFVQNNLGGASKCKSQHSNFA
jgi:ATP-dependent Zn protease